MPPDPRASKRVLVDVLRLAYSGELAAGLAYRGHWRSLRDALERERVQRIEAEEWRHRQLVGEILARLGARPSRLREARAWLIGRTLGALCHVSGWFAPMYGAGRLESRNVREYVSAARHARDSNHEELVDCLLEMAEVEWEHELYFREQAAGHPWWRRVPRWQAPGPKPGIREAFALEHESERPRAVRAAPDRLLAR